MTENRLPLTDLDSVRRLLYNSWRDIHFEYDGLTSDEKRCIEREAFNRVVAWVAGVRKAFARLERGTMVVAVRQLDPEGANVQIGDKGVVFEEAEFHGEGYGPLVRWCRGGCCNVYLGDVTVLAPLVRERG